MTYVSAGCEGQGTTDAWVSRSRPPTHGRGALRQRAGKGQISLGRVLEEHSSVRFGRPPLCWAGEGKSLQEPAHSAKTIILDDL